MRSTLARAALVLLLQRLALTPAALAAETEEDVPSLGKAGLPVTGKVAEVLRKLGRRRFMLGITNSPQERQWLVGTQGQGCLWDMRYQYLAGGVNTRRPWKEWNAPPGQYVVNYMRDSERMGVVPVFTWYQMRQSKPGHEVEWRANSVNCANVETMRQYLSDVKFFMQLAADHGKPVIFHVEPDLSGFFLVFSQFRPNDPEGIRVMVRSTGLPELAEFEDNLVGFYRAIAALRDRFAPNCLLAWHASMWMEPPPIRRIADTIRKSGSWDIVFVDPSDRDSAWKIANGYHVNGAWWDDGTFANWLKWCGQLHEATGLPMIAWQIPTGNTIMAACNDTRGHYMDNRPEYWLEGYPQNKHVLEWARAGFIGLLFGRGAGGCTHFGDAEGDGVTNPPPIEGNRGETSTFPDDDGGYLRLRGADYYRAPLALFLPEDLRRLAKRRRPSPKARRADPLKIARPKPGRSRPDRCPDLKPGALEAWGERLLARVREAVAEAGRVRFSMAGLQQPLEIVSVDEAGRMRLAGGATEMDVEWSKLGVRDRRNLAMAVLREGDAEGHGLAALFLIATGEEGAAREHLVKAADLAAEVEGAFEKIATSERPEGDRAGRGPDQTGRTEPGEPRTTRRPARTAAAPAVGPAGTEPDAAAVLYRDAETAFIDGDIDGARGLFEKLVRELPESEYTEKAKSYLEIIE